MEIMAAIKKTTAWELVDGSDHELPNTKGNNKNF